MKNKQTNKQTNNKQTIKHTTTKQTNNKPIRYLLKPLLINRQIINPSSRKGGLYQPP